MSPQIITHSVMTSGGISWDDNLAARSPYVIGLEGCIFRKVVDTVAELVDITNPAIGDRAFVWGADSSESHIYEYSTGGAWVDKGAPLSNVQYVDMNTRESMYFYNVEPDTSHYFNVSLPSTSHDSDYGSILGLVSNCYVLGAFSAYYNTNVSGYSATFMINYTNCTTESISNINTTKTVTNYTIPIKTNGIFWRIGRGEGATGSVLGYIGFKAATT